MSVGEQLRDDPLRRGRRHREGQVLRALDDCGVDADDARRRVDERAARVARVDRCVGLYEVDLLVWDANLGGGARQRRDDAERDRRVEPDGVADGDRPIADLQLIRAPERGGRQRLPGRLDADGGQVHELVGAPHQAVECAPVDERDRHLGRILHHVGIGHDEPIFRQDDAGALPGLAPLPVALAAAVGEKVPLERGPVHQPLRVDADDRRTDGLHRRSHKRRLSPRAPHRRRGLEAGQPQVD
mmetsp:Transcript_1895/g.5989  ORF Transcript_1895/g.5989 Transcript_1895/m.5989 type:complete len:243 (-) Transcript_1895:1470-2198(-)